MATVGPSQQNPGSSNAPPPQPPPGPPSSEQITWEGDKMFNIYILDYCKKRGYHKTATQLVTEADIPPESKPPINAQQGLLFEWWSVFWVLFQAKNSGAGSEDAILYTKYQTQSKFQAQRGQVPPPVGPQPPPRYPIPNGVPGTAPSLPGGQMNGIGPGGQLAHYGQANPPSQPNGMPGHPGPPGPPGQPFPPGMINRPPMGHQQRHPNGAPQYSSPTIAPSPQSQGGPQQPSGPMGPLGPSPHMNRAAMPPPNGPQQHPQGPGSIASAHQTPTPSYQQLSRPHSSHDNSSQNHMNPHPSPAMSGRLPPGQERSHMDGSHSSLDADMAAFPADLLGEAKLRLGLGEREAQSLNADEKQNIIQLVSRLKHGGPPPNNGIGAPPGASMHGPLQNRGPLAQPMQQQMSMQQQRGAKRNSTSPGEEHETLPRNEQSPPDRKRLRKTPNPAEQQQQHSQQSQQSQPPPPPPPQQQHQQHQPPPQHQPPQQQPQLPMAPIGPLPPGSMRGHTPLGQPLNGFGGPQMHQMGMAPMAPMHGMSPSMMHGHPPGVMNPQMSQSQLYAQQYRQAMVNVHKNNPNVPVPVGPSDPQSHMRGPGPPIGGRPPGQLGPQQPPQSSQPPKGPMLPPGQAGMNGPPSLKKEEVDMNPGGSASTPGALLNNAQSMNPQRPPTASGPAPPSQPPVSMPELPFDMAEMFANPGGVGEFDFHSSLTDMELWFDPAPDGTSLEMK